MGVDSAFAQGVGGGVKYAGFAIHLFTGLGAVCALLAVEGILAGEWTKVFLWLGVAFLIDGVDGPIARAVDVQAELPRFSGEHIDLVIDYLTYVFIPALVLLAANRLPEQFGYVFSALILLTSLFHFSDVESKANDQAFVGFPAIWNILAFYVFALDLSQVTTAVLIMLASFATFLPLHWVHPIRVTLFRPVTLTFTAAWALAAIFTVLSGFPASPAVQVVLVGVAIYGLGVSAWLSWRQKAS